MARAKAVNESIKVIIAPLRRGRQAPYRQISADPLARVASYRQKISAKLMTI